MSERYWRPTPLSTNPRAVATCAILPAVRITGIRLDRLVLPLDPPFPAAWDPVPRTVVRGDDRPGRDRRGRRRASGPATRWTGSRRSSTCSSARTRWRSPATSASLETIDFHAGRYWPLEVALWDIVGQVAGLPVATLFGGATDGIPAYASCGMLLPPAARAESALRAPRRGVPGAQDPGRSAPARGGAGGGRGDPRRGRRLDGDHGRPQPGLADGRRHVAARSIRSPPARSPRGWPTTASCGSRSRWPARTCAAWRRCAPRRPGIRIAGGEMTRTFAELLAALEADAFDVHQPDVVLAAGMLRTPDARRARPRPQPLVHAAHLDERDRPAGQPARRGRRRRRAVPRVPVRPARLDRRSGATSCSPSRSGPDPTASCACPPTPGLGIVLDEAALRRYAA